MSDTRHAAQYCPAEIMTAFLARDLKDGELGVFGSFSQIPWAACRLAQATHAPNLWCICGPSAAVNSNLPKLMWSVSDHRMHQGAEGRITLDGVMDMQGNPTFIDFGFYGGFQIDKYGNLNMAYVGDQKKPRFRGPGTVGTMATAWLNRVYLFTHAHSPRLFVDKVDFISGPGFIDGPEGRRKAGSPARSEGPRYIVTPICVFDFDEETKQHVFPYVIEPAAGADRATLAFLVDAYDVDKDDEQRVVLRLHPDLAPIKAAVLPLVKKEGMPEKAEKIYRDLLDNSVRASMDINSAIGRRYARQDEAGTPFCITVDGQSIQDDTVTIRERDSRRQYRAPATGVVSEIAAKLKEARK